MERTPIMERGLPTSTLIQMAISEAIIFGANKDVRKSWPPETEHNGHIRAMLQKNTYGKCHLASLRSIYTLYSQDADRFNVMATLESKYNPDEVIEEEDFRNPLWNNHVYFLLRDNEDIWYAGSPANYSPDYPDVHTRLLASSNLQDILTQIKQADGGMWPDAERTQSMIRIFKQTMPRIDVYSDSSEIEVLHLSQNGKSFGAMTQRYSLNAVL